jgi:glycerol-3-phosphate dehydrogenase
MHSRDRHLARATGLHFDLLVVGGGITGAGVARDAARRGLRVLLVDQGDLAQGTSSRSSKLVHGGLRYLEHGQIGLVFESVSERRILMEIAPHLVRPLPFLFPVYRQQGRSPLVLGAGMWLYDGLSLFRSPQLHRRLSRADILNEEPTLAREGLRSAELYYDCGTDDGRLTLETALDAVEWGATLLTWCRWEAFLHHPSGRIVGARLRDRLTDQLLEVSISAAVNATGPWTDMTLALCAPRPTRLLRPTKGVHIVVDRERLPVRYATVMVHPKDRRVLFAIPWGERTYLGTTDTDWNGDPDLVAADRDDVGYLLEAAEAFFPERKLREDDVLATWAGLRPLLSQEGIAESSVSREHRVLVDLDGLVTVAGGKLTTYRRMAAEVVERVLDVLRLSGHDPGPLEAPMTDREALPGAVGWPEGEVPAIGASSLEATILGRLAASVQDRSRGRLGPDTARLLVETLGMRARDLADACARDPLLAEPLLPGRPECLGQVLWAVEREEAQRLQDVLIRRLNLFFKDEEQGLGCADAVSRAMARSLDWSEARRLAEVEDYRAEVARSRAWRSEA